MKIVRDRPPLWDEIDKKFQVRGRPVIFSWGSIIYVPSGSLEVHPSLVAHERVHGERQLAYVVPGESRVQLTPEERIVVWWRRYISDPTFRRNEEVLAHVAEYRHLCEHAGGRNQRRRHLSVVASKLASPLYGPMMNKTAAREALSNGYSAHP
jgi:hypothetical protein